MYPSATRRTVTLWDEMTPDSHTPSATPWPRYDVFTNDTGARCLSTDDLSAANDRASQVDGHVVDNQR